MSSQGRYDPLEASPLFADGRSARPEIPGTVSRDEELNDTIRTGLAVGRFIPTLPIPLTLDLLRRGQQRFDIYCAPCHSTVGDGDGMIVRRGYQRPPSLHEPRLRLAPLGHFFDVITNGFATMPRFSYQLTPRDRWAIAAYIRVLQQSQAATLADVPEPLRPGLPEDCP